MIEQIQKYVDGVEPWPETWKGMPAKDCAINHLLGMYRREKAISKLSDSGEETKEEPNVS